MTDKITIERETLEALESMLGDFCVSGRATDAMRALSRKVAAALAAQPAEPVAWAGCGDCDCSFSCHNGEARCIRLKLAPAAVPLTAERVMELAREHGCVYTNRHYPTSPAVSFSHDKLQAFVQAVLAAGDKP